MAYLIGQKPSPPDEWYQARLAKLVNRSPSEILPEGWRELAILDEMELLTKLQNLLTGGQGHHMGPDTLLLLKSLRDEAKKQWPKS